MKAQLGVLGLISVFILLIIYIALLPALQSIISSTVPDVDSTTGAFIQIIPIIGIAAIIYLFFRPREAEGNV